MNSTPNYYAVIPANVRYSDMSLGAKLIYGEISSLSNTKGYCWASNSYFADLYKVDTDTISRWISELFEMGFINRDVDKKDGNRRKLTLSVKMPRAIRKNAEHNNKDNKSLINNKDNEVVFDLKEELKKLKNSPQRHIQLIGEFLEEKNIRLETKQQLNRAISRHLKAARALADFSDKQIGEATGKAEKEYPAYTLETLVKILTR